MFDKDKIFSILCTLRANDKRQVRDLCELFISESLTHEQYPESCFDLIIDISSSDEICRIPGIDCFFVNFYSDFFRLTELQKRAFYNSIIKNYPLYVNRDLCLVLSDLVARKYEVNEVIYFVKTCFLTASKQGKEGIALSVETLLRCLSKVDITQCHEHLDDVVKMVLKGSINNN